MARKKGRLIVIDGTDGTGKTTQVDLLAKRLRKEGRSVRILDFPEYYQNFFGALLGECLRDPAYDFINVHAKIASTIFAADRWESKERIERWLKKGYIVIANRYVSSNQIHQAAKIKDSVERRDFLRWLDTLEHKTFGIPRPDVVLYLSLPIRLSLELIEERDKKESRAYLKKSKDVHESDPAFLEASRKSALRLVKELNNFVKIDCAPRGKLKTREEVHELVYAAINE